MSESTCRQEPGSVPIDRSEYEIYESNLAQVLWHHRENEALREESRLEGEYWKRLAEQERQQVDAEIEHELKQVSHDSSVGYYGYAITGHANI